MVALGQLAGLDEPVLQLLDAGVPGLDRPVLPVDALLQRPHLFLTLSLPPTSSMAIFSACSPSPAVFASICLSFSS